MGSVERFTKGAQAVVLSAAVASTELLKHYIEKLIPGESAAYQVGFFVVLIFVILLLVHGVQVAVELIVERSRWLRRIILGRAFIEGVWKDAVVTEGGSETWTGGLLFISYEHGGMMVRGETFDGVGRRVGSFGSSFAQFSEDDARLRYTFSKNVNAGQTGYWDGYSEYFFNTVANKKTFDGHYVRKGDPIQYSVRGQRLSRAEAKQTNSDIGKSEIIQQYINEVKSQRMINDAQSSAVVG